MANSKILLVDDDESVRKLFSLALRSAGYHVVVAENGEIAWALFKGDKGFDAVVTDNDMPLVSGVQLAGRVKALRPEVPVLLVSSGRVESVADCFLEKPISPSVLAREVAKHIERRGK